MQTERDIYKRMLQGRSKVAGSMAHLNGFKLEHMAAPGHFCLRQCRAWACSSSKAMPPRAHPYLRCRLQVSELARPSASAVPQHGSLVVYAVLDVAIA
jgi:hypothetical protein